jgi:hypothetical protein
MEIKNCDATVPISRSPIVEGIIGLKAYNNECDEN